MNKFSPEKIENFRIFYVELRSNVQGYRMGVLHFLSQNEVRQRVP